MGRRHQHVNEHVSSLAWCEMHTDMRMQKDREPEGRPVRLWVYWISSALSTLIFILFTFVMAMVPGVPIQTKFGMIAIEVGLLASSLVIGIWGAKTGEVPFESGMMGRIVGVVLICELAVCLWAAIIGFRTLNP